MKKIYILIIFLINVAVVFSQNSAVNIYYEINDSTSSYLFKYITEANFKNVSNNMIMKIHRYNYNEEKVEIDTISVNKIQKMKFVDDGVEIPYFHITCIDRNYGYLGVNDIDSITFEILENKYQIFHNGNIYINADEKVNNLLVKNGTVEGYNIDFFTYPDAEFIDLQGQSAYPGFNDSHVHLMETSPFFVLGINMTNCFDADCMAEAIKKRVDPTISNQLLVGVGFSLEDYDKWNLQDLKKIDDAAGDNFVFLGDKLGHNVLVNTKTLKLCGIIDTAEAPLGGRIVAEDGVLTGMLRESATALAGNVIFKMIGKDVIKNTSLNMFNRWASIGYTGIVDLMGSVAGRLMTPEIAIELEQEGKLPIRMMYCYTFYDLNEIDSAVKYKNPEYNTDMVRFIGGKLFVDGAYAAGQAWTSWENKQGNNGLYYVYPSDKYGEKYNLNRMVQKLEDNNLNCHYHIQGDQGIENLLNALDSVKAKNGEIKGIHTIIHCAFPTETQIQRMKGFNGKVVLTMQPGFWEVEDSLEYYYGDKNYEAYPVKELIEAGLSVGFSTDFTVSPIDYTPVTKVIGVSTTGGGKPEHHTPLSIRDMVHGFSYGSYATTGATDLGKLEIGYKADMVVYDNDLYQIKASDFTKDYPKVTSIWIGGRLTYLLKK